MRVGVFTYDTMLNYRFFGNNRTVKRYEKRKVTGLRWGSLPIENHRHFFTTNTTTPSNTANEHFRQAIGIGIR